MVFNMPDTNSKRKYDVFNNTNILFSVQNSKYPDYCSGHTFLLIIYRYKV